MIRPMLEYSFHRHFSACLTYEKGKFSRITRSTGYMQAVDEYNTTGWGISPQLRYYPFTAEKRSPLGFFLGINYRYRELNEYYGGQDYSINIALPVYTELNTKAVCSMGGVDLGYKANIGLVTIELLIGFQQGVVKWSESNERYRINPEVRKDGRLTNNPVRVELSAGFVFPRVKNDRVLKDIADYVETIEPELKDLAQVIIYRPRSLPGWQIAYPLTANDSLIGEVTNGFFYSLKVRPGKVVFKARTGSMSSLTLFLEKGRTYYLKCGLSGGPLVAKQPKLELVKPSKGQYESNNL
ncbi:MAG: hypothetical protein JNL60_10220 [Bacteroidia bacterium]|nr:hypothetical protein [Bacteroidia bacterium]